MITMSQTPDLSPKPAHFSQNALPGQCLPDPAQPSPLSIHASIHWEFPQCFHLPAQSNPKLSPAHVPFLPGFGPTSLPSPQILLLSPNLFPSGPSIFLNITSRTPQLFSSVSRPLGLAFWGVVSAYLFSPPPPFPPSGSDSSQVPTDL